MTYIYTYIQIISYSCIKYRDSCWPLILVYFVLPAFYMASSAGLDVSGALAGGLRL